MVIPQQQTTINEFGNVVSAGYSNTSGNGGIECEVVPMPKFQMGRIIGQRGVTINDLQKRSGCDIQIDQKNAQPGQDCPVSIKGSRQGIETAKKMLQDIIEMGHMHPYAGGRKCQLALAPRAALKNTHGNFIPARRRSSEQWWFC